MVEDLPGELWKDIPGFENLYQVSSLGRVKSLPKRGRDNEILMHPATSHTRPRISPDYILYKNKKNRGYSIGNLIYRTFIGDIPNGYQVNVLDKKLPVTVDNVILVKKGTSAIVTNYVEEDKFKVYRGSKVYAVRKEYKKVNTEKHHRRSPVYYLTIKCYKCGKLFEMRYVSRKTNLAQCKDCRCGGNIKHANKCRENNKEALHYNSLRYKPGDYIDGCKIVNYFKGDELPYEIECKYCGKHFRSKYSIMTRRKDLNCGCQPTYKYDYLDLNYSSKLYRKWCAIKRRCSPADKKNADKYYNRKTAFNGVGIRVCKLWENSYEEFYNWALSVGYSEDKPLAIDRILSDGDYAPFNCQFLSIKDNIIKSNTFDTLGEKFYAQRKEDYEKRKTTWIEEMKAKGYDEKDLI